MPKYRLIDIAFTDLKVEFAIDDSAVSPADPLPPSSEGPAFGQMVMELNEHETIISAPSSDFSSATIVTNWTDGQRNGGMAADPSDGRIVPLKAGYYEVLVTVSISNTPSDISMAVFGDNGDQKLPRSSRRLGPTRNDTASMSLSGIVHLAAMEGLCLSVQNETNDTNVLLKDAAFTVIKL